MKAFVFLGLSLVACGVIRMAQPIERRVLIPVSIAEREMIYVDESGKEAISTVFWEAEPFQKDLALVLTRGDTKDLRYALIDRRGNIVFKSPWKIGTTVWLYEEHGVILVRDHGKPEDQKAGVFDLNGNTIVPFEFEKISKFDDRGMARVTRGGRDGYIDTSGKLVLPLEWESIHLFNKRGIAVAWKNHRAGAIDREGNTVIPFEWKPLRFDRYGSFEFAEAFKDGKCGLVRHDGKVVIPPAWGSIGVVQGRGLNRAVARTDERAELIDIDTGTTVSSGWDALWPMQGFGQNEFIVSVRDEKYGMIDLEGNEIVPPEWDSIDPWGFDGPLIVEKDGLFGLLDWKGNTVVEPKWDYVGRWRNGMLTAMKDDLYGAVNRQGETVIEFTHEKLSDFDFGGYAGVYVGEKVGLMRVDGKVISDPAWDKMLTSGFRSEELRDYQKFSMIRGELDEYGRVGEEYEIQFDLRNAEGDLIWSSAQERTIAEVPSEAGNWWIVGGGIACCLIGWIFSRYFRKQR